MNLKLTTAERNQEAEDLFQRFFLSIVFGIALLSAIGIPVNVLRALKFGLDPTSIFHLSNFPVLIAIFFLRKRIPFQVLAWMFIAVIWVAGAAELLAWGILGSAEIILAGVILTVGISQSRKNVLILTVLTGLLYLVVGGLFVNGALQPRVDARIYAASLQGWIIAASVFMVFVGLLSERTGWMIREIDASTGRIQAHNEKLLEEIGRRKESQEVLEHMIQKKETLLKEVHHKVKSNLQIISGLIDLQAGQSANPEVRRISKVSENRILSMAAIHETLYRSDNLSRLNLKNLVETLCRNTEDAFGLKEKNISLRTQVEEVELGMDKAVPFALVVNEVVNNAIIHGFTEPFSGGEINVSLSVLDKGEIQAEIRDNGKGIGDRLDHRNPSGMGYNLINIITEEMGARYAVSDDNGTVFRIAFPI